MQVGTGHTKARALLNLRICLPLMFEGMAQVTQLDVKFLIAVDGGGTGCRAAVGTVEKGILGTSEGGPANVSTNFDRAVLNIGQAISAAATNAGINADDLSQAHAHLALAGVVDQTTALKVAQALPYANANVTEDIKGAIAGALGTKDGFVVALGTGTIIARQQARTYNRVGGWGFDVSDQASGSWLGHQLLRQTVLCADGIEPHSNLTRQIISDLGAPAGIMHFARGATPKVFATYARAIISNANEGDAQAIALMQRGADYVALGLGALGFSAGDPLCLIGGVGPHYAPFLPTKMTDALVQPLGSNLEGAFALARDAALVGVG